jgi:hypothetical protein
MSCCGRYRKAVADGTAQTNTAAQPGSIAFEYIGRTALTVIGPGSRRTYRFEQPGARLPVDTRDRPALDALPMLKRC